MFHYSHTYGMVFWYYVHENFCSIYAFIAVSRCWFTLIRVERCTCIYIYIYNTYIYWMFQIGHNDIRIICFVLGNVKGPGCKVINGTDSVILLSCMVTGVDCFLIIFSIIWITFAGTQGNWTPTAPITAELYLLSAFLWFIPRVFHKMVRCIL